MAAPNYDHGSCCIYEGWRFGSVKRKTRCLRRRIEPDRYGGHPGNREGRSEKESSGLQPNRCVVRRMEACRDFWCLM
jgi:hypothetical protein